MERAAFFACAARHNHCPHRTIFLAEYVKHHIKEEEKELFPAVRQMKDLDLDQLGENMRRRRDELFAEMESGEEQSKSTSARENSPADGDPVSSSDDVDEEEEFEDEQEMIDISKTRH